MMTKECKGLPASYSLLFKVKPPTILCGGKRPLFNVVCADDMLTQVNQGIIPS